MSVHQGQRSYKGCGGVLIHALFDEETRQRNRASSGVPAEPSSLSRQTRGSSAQSFADTRQATSGSSFFTVHAGVSWKQGCRTQDETSSLKLERRRNLNRFKGKTSVGPETLTFGPRQNFSVDPENIHRRSGLSLGLLRPPTLSSGGQDTMFPTGLQKCPVNQSTLSFCAPTTQLTLRPLLLQWVTEIIPINNLKACKNVMDSVANYSRGINSWNEACNFVYHPNDSSVVT